MAKNQHAKCTWKNRKTNRGKAKAKEKVSKVWGEQGEAGGGCQRFRC